jgi:hypothetical protein
MPCGEEEEVFDVVDEAIIERTYKEDNNLGKMIFFLRNFLLTFKSTHLKRKRIFFSIRNFHLHASKEGKQTRGAKGMFPPSHEKKRSHIRRNPRKIEGKMS